MRELVQHKIQGGEGLKKRRITGEVQTRCSWESEPLISLCFKLPWKWRQGEFSSPPQSICLSDGVSWGQGSAVAWAENDVKGGRVCLLPSWSRPCSHFVVVFFGQNPCLSPCREPAGDISPTAHGSSCLGWCCCPVIRALQMLSPTRGFFFCKPLTGFEGMKGFGYLQVPSQPRLSRGGK